jgi:uncharacterized protein
MTTMSQRSSQAHPPGHRPRWPRVPRRRGLLALAAAALAIVALANCGGERGTDAADASAGPWHGGRLSIATGNTTGVYYQLGGGYADLITKHLPRYQATAEATGASAENIQRIARGDADIAFTLADTANDAATGNGTFDSPMPIRALARIYTNYTQVVATNGSGIGSVADMRGKRISTGSPNSGTEVIALRLLKAAGLDPENDIHRQSLSLPETVQGMKDGTLDGLFWSGGLPTGGLTDLMTSLKDDAMLIPLDDLLPKLQAEHGDVYAPATVSKDIYQLPSDVPTIAVPNLLVVSDQMPEQLAHDLTKLLFDRQPDLSKVHAEGNNIKRDKATATGSVQLHPGAKRYYDTT